MEEFIHLIEKGYEIIVKALQLAGNLVITFGRAIVKIYPHILADVYTSDNKDKKKN